MTQLGRAARSVVTVEPSNWTRHLRQAERHAARRHQLLKLLKIEDGAEAERLRLPASRWEARLGGEERGAGARLGWTRMGRCKPGQRDVGQREMRSLKCAA